MASRLEENPPDNRMSVDVALLTGGGDRPYALGLTSCLTESGLTVDFIGSDFLDCPELRDNTRVRFLNLRGDVNPAAAFASKLMRVLRYYARLIWYAARSEAPAFHILWNNKFETFDRTLLLLYYRLLGKKLVLTVHNVNAGQRDASDSRWNRMTLLIQYRLVHHLFVHTDLMKRQLADGYNVPESRISVIPFGLNETVPVTDLTRHGARARLGIRAESPVLLFFGNIAPYKGVEYLVQCMPEVLREFPDVVLVIAGRPKGQEGYWNRIASQIDDMGIGKHVYQHIEYIADEDTEVYFKAADALVLPYTEVFQSGVLVLGYSFGLMVIASDVGSLKDDVMEGVTGYVCTPRDARSLAAAVMRFCNHWSSPVEESHRKYIRDWAASRYSWAVVGARTVSVYRQLLAREMELST